MLAALAAGGCSGRMTGPPEIVVDRTSCDHCRMLISDVRYAAAVEAPNADVKVFDDIGCLLEAVKKSPFYPDGYYLHRSFWITGDKFAELVEAEHEAYTKLNTEMGLIGK